MHASDTAFPGALGRHIGTEAGKTLAAKLKDGFFDRYLSGENVLDIGYRGYSDDVEPVLPHAIGVELDYPGYDGRTLPFPAGSQDAVYNSHCLEHITDYAQAIREWFRVLKVGGYLIIMVPHQFLYEKRTGLPSRWNADHKRFYTPARLIQEIEESLPPNAYRLRHLVDNDAGYDYGIGPERHAGGCYEIEMVIQKIALPAWTLEAPVAPGLSAVPKIGAILPRAALSVALFLQPVARQLPEAVKRPLRRALHFVAFRD